MWRLCPQQGVEKVDGEYVAEVEDDADGFFAVGEGEDAVMYSYVPPSAPGHVLVMLQFVVAR